MVKQLSHDAVPLSLSHGPLSRLVTSAARPAVSLLWEFDGVLGAALRQARDPSLKLMRLLWWRDALSASGDMANPLLRGIHESLLPTIGAQPLTQLIEHWADFAEAETLTETVAGNFADARGLVLYELTARLCGSPTGLGAGAGSLWGMVDLALNISDPLLAARLLHLAKERWTIRSDNPVSALAALDRLSAGIARRNGRRHLLYERILRLRVALV